MTLTVRLPQPLEETLEAYSLENGLTKSHVVQEALAQYFVKAERHSRRDRGKPVSENYAALRKAGLIGCISGMNGESATREVVRKRILESVKNRRS